ncbi:cytochrome C peroxidase [Sorangium sp. So ce233]|uniref:cytochrome C peroxidase n=1 Tax=Sorangium sp. So ce233 TaxID=3133290 RepID=UPI003F6163E2
MRAAAPTAVALLLLACSPGPRDPAPAPHAAPAPSAAALAAPPPAPPCARHGTGPAPAPLDPTHAGSGVALAGLGGRTLAFIADEDDAALHTVDLDARSAIARTPLAGRPAQVIVLGDGRVVASLRDRGLLEVLEPVDAAAPLARRCLVPVASEPVGLAMTPDRATLLVASRWGHALTSFATVDLRPLGELPLARDPSAVVASADGQRAFVSHAVGGRISVVALGEGGAPTEARELSTDGVEWRFRPLLSKKFMSSAFPPDPPRPPAPAPSASARRAAFAPSGGAPVVSRVERRGSQGFALARAPSGAVFAPIALVDPGPETRGSGGYGGARAQTVIEHIAVVDAKGGRADVPPVSSSLGTLGCQLPRAAAIEPGEEVLLVTCLGRDEVIAYDARAQIPGQPPQVGSVRDRELFRARVGAGPTAIAVDSARRRAVVFSRFDGELTILPAARDPGPTEYRAPSKEPAGELPVIVLPRASRLDELRAEGQRLFHAAGDRRTAFDGRACASCHPDGRDDALTWSTPEGPRQTPMLMGRLDGTAPYGWEGDKKDLEGHFARTLSRLGGSGLRPDERDALFAYLRGMAPPGEATALAAEERAVTVTPPPAARGGAAASAARGAAAASAAARADLVARGDALFHSSKAGCSNCHLGDELTTDGARHDVRSATRFDAARAFETPSLRFVGRSAPYYHDGRYPTLLALVEGVDGTMGHTAHLSADDRRALVTYLESL